MKKFRILSTKKRNMISFVQEREVWNYNKEENKDFCLVFSFADGEEKDIRSRNHNHEIDLISMDNKGNTTFVVCGYMNRGMHEGQVDAGIYYFNSEKNYVEEKRLSQAKNQVKLPQKI